MKAILPNAAMADAQATLLRSLATSNNALAADLWAGLGGEPGNLAMSPASISLALGMVLTGAREETAEQMRSVMHLSLAGRDLERAYATLIYAWLSAPKEHNGLELRLANRVFTDNKFDVEPPFVAAVEQGFGAPLEQLDFGQYEACRAHINGWVEAQTRERIRDLLPPNSIDALTRMALVNALYFRAKWRHPFDKLWTEDASFHAPSGERQVAMMQTGGHYAYGETAELQLLTLPYEDRRFAMTIALPKQRDGLAAAEATLSAGTLDSWLAAMTSQRVSIKLPKCRIDPPSSLSLRAVLKGLGMQEAFERFEARFTGIAVPATPADNLYIGAVFHKCFVAIDEAGTEAAAATAVMAPVGGAAPREAEKPKQFVADHPFLFVIHDVATGMVAFLGRVVDPA
jgi:serpin B